MTGLLLCAHVPYCFIYKLLIMNKRFRTLPFHDYIMDLSRSNTNFFNPTFKTIICPIHT